MGTVRPELGFLIIKVCGFSLLFALWLQGAELAGFFLLLALVLLSILRWRFPSLRATILLDVLLVVLLLSLWGAALWALALIMLEGFYRRFYGVGIALLVALFVASSGFGVEFPITAAVSVADDQVPALGTFAVLLVLSGLSGLFLSLWQSELKQKKKLRDEQASKYYELEQLQGDLTGSLPQIERMTAVAERARIARDLHDNAGHEIVAAYISLQTARAMLEGKQGDSARVITDDVLELYDAALKRLDVGVNKVRETAHNLQTVSPLSIESLSEICKSFPVCPVNFRAYGDAAQVPVYGWNVLESVLNESLTNVARHARPSFVSVELDITDHLVRLCIENNGIAKSNFVMGSGLRSLRYRTMVAGGNFSVDAAENFKVVCVIPIKKEQDEGTPS